MLRKALALREYFQTVPLYLREHDGLAGSISELPGAMPVIVELGIGENNIYTGERPDREGYLQGQVPEEIRDYWKNRNMWGLYRTEILGQKPYDSADEVPQALSYKFISNQGHLSPSYGELLRVGIGGVLARVQTRKRRRDRCRQAGVSGGRRDIADRPFRLDRPLRRVPRRASRRAASRRARAAELREMSRIAAKVATRSAARPSAKRCS